MTARKNAKRAKVEPPVEDEGEGFTNDEAIDGINDDAPIDETAADVVVELTPAQRVRSLGSPQDYAAMFRELAIEQQLHDDRLAPLGTRSPRWSDRLRALADHYASLVD